MYKFSIIFLILICLIGCSDNSAVSSSAPTTTCRVATVNHDGHMFVMAYRDGAGGISIIHHPSCKCKGEK